MMDEATRVHKLDRKIIKHFYLGMELFNQGFSEPIVSSTNPFDQAQLAGWRAARDMDAVKKQWLQQVKDEWVK